MCSHSQKSILPEIQVSEKTRAEHELRLGTDEAQDDFLRDLYHPIPVQEEE
jgi:hypothetical protein